MKAEDVSIAVLIDMLSPQFALYQDFTLRKEIAGPPLDAAQRVSFRPLEAYAEGVGMAV
jgi:hypothetical protein